MRGSARAFRLGFTVALVATLASIGDGAHAQTANAQPVIADLPVSSGGTERVLFIAAPQPRATVVLLSGGSGVLAIDDAGNIRPGGNFLVRTRGLWAAQGFAVVVPGPPNGASLLGTRHSPAYLAALGAVIDYARSRVNAPVWVIGTSQGSTGAANGAAHLEPKVAGVVLTSSVTRTGRAGETVFNADPGAIAVPALVVSNSGDACTVSPPGDGPQLLAALTRSPRKELILVQSSQIQSDPCEAFSPHGYLGIEAMVVQRIADWIKAAPGR
jgi:pimeloyl-ACP methyl ester carboxylesterase